MPLELTPTGLNKQDFEEIREELRTEYRLKRGPNIVVDPDSVYGEHIDITAEREASIQCRILEVYSNQNPNTATGVDLAALSSLTATVPKGETNSKSTAGKITGTPATSVENTHQFRLIQTNDLWQVSGGPYVIPGGGTLSNIEITAVEAGAKTFLATPSVEVDPLGWSIEIGPIGLDEFETEADIDPEDIGQDEESDEDLRARRTIEVFAGGNDNSAIRANVFKVDGVTEVFVRDNPDCLAVVNGIPGGAFETVVEGGLDADIADAIFEKRPPGAESFGTIITSISDGEGGFIDIGHTRPINIDIHVKIEISTTGAEATFPTNGLQLIEDAFLLAANKTTQIDRNVIPKSFYTFIFDAVKDPDSGFDSITSVIMAMSTSEFGPFSEDTIVIEFRERSDFDTTRTAVQIGP